MQVIPKILDFIFPKFCLTCQRFGSYLCLKCRAEILQKQLICPNCEQAAIGGATHPLCRKKYGLDGLWSFASYEEPISSLIQTLKYEFAYDLAEFLTDLLIEYWARNSAWFLELISKNNGDGWLIIPVPLHWKRQNFRGFNQSALIGKILSKRLGLDYSDCLKRVRNTKPQVGLEGWQRQKNIKNAFLLAKPLAIQPNVLLIDDVWTTGSTMKECCYVLKLAGVQTVWAVTLAR